MFFVVVLFLWHLIISLGNPYAKRLSCTCLQYLNLRWILGVSKIYTPFASFYYWPFLGGGSINRDYDMAIFISFPISTRDTYISPSAEGPRADMCRGLISGMIWKLPYHNLFIIHFSFWQICLSNIVCGVKSKTVECSQCGDMGFLPGQKIRITHVTWWYGFFGGQKRRITHVTHHHTFCAPQEWYVLESHVRITSHPITQENIYLRKFSYIIMKLPHRGDSSEYIQHTIIV